MKALSDHLAFVIRLNNKGHWNYYFERSKGETAWDDLYGIHGAKQFLTRDEAEAKLFEKSQKEYWGGIFQIEEIYVIK